MKAAMVVSKGVLAVREVAVPVPDDYEVLCQLLYGATCTGTDQHIIHGRVPWPVPHPVILGHESVGRVVRAGPNVRHFKEGDLLTRVGMPPAPDGSHGIMWGGFAEYGVARDHRAMREDGRPRAEWDGFRVNQVVPPSIEPRTATMIITWRETLSYVTRLGVQAGASVLVVGSGGNGLACMAHARNLGAVQRIMAGNPSREAIASAAGATAYFDYHIEDLANAAGGLCPDGFDFIIDAVGKGGVVDRVLPLLKPGGTVSIYGIDEFHNASINPRLARGSFICAAPEYDEEETHDAVVKHILAGRLDASIWLDMDGACPLDEISRAFDAIRERKVVKALIKLTDD